MHRCASHGVFFSSGNVRAAHCGVLWSGLAVHCIALCVLPNATFSGPTSRPATTSKSRSSLSYPRFKGNAVESRRCSSGVGESFNSPAAQDAKAVPTDAAQRPRYDWPAAPLCLCAAVHRVDQSRAAEALVPTPQVKGRLMALCALADGHEAVGRAESQIRSRRYSNRTRAAMPQDPFANSSEPLDLCIATSNAAATACHLRADTTAVCPRLARARRPHSSRLLPNRRIHLFGEENARGAGLRGGIDRL